MTLLFTGTKNGQLLSINIERNTCQQIWNADTELINKEDTPDDIMSDNLVSIRRISWLAPQSDASAGCLFVLLSTHGPDNDNLQNIILGIVPKLIGEVSINFAVPPIQGTKIITFRVIPTYEKSDVLNRWSSKENILELSEKESKVTPGLLLLTQKQNDFDKSKYVRQLKLLRCPQSNISEWGLEIGALPEPRLAAEVQPAHTELTLISGVVPSYESQLSLCRAFMIGLISKEDRVVSTGVQRHPSVAALLEDETAVKTENNPPVSPPPPLRQVSRKISTGGVIEYEEPDKLETWEVVLVQGEHTESRITHGLRIQDFVFIGHNDG